jgi:hypothetical protein
MLSVNMWILVSNKNEVKEKLVTLSIIDKLEILEKLDSNVR